MIQTIAGTALLTRYTEYMNAGDRRGAIEFRDALTPEQRETFYRALRSAWIPVDQNESRMAWSIVSLPTSEDADRVQMIRDIALICASHHCAFAAEIDARIGAVKLIFTGIVEPVRKVILAWARGYGQAPVPLSLAVHPGNPARDSSSIGTQMPLQA